MPPQLRNFFDNTCQMCLSAIMTSKNEQQVSSSFCFVKYVNVMYKNKNKKNGIVHSDMKMLAKLNLVEWSKFATEELMKREELIQSQAEQVRSAFLVMEAFPNMRDQLLRQPELVLTDEFQRKVEHVQNQSRLVRKRGSDEEAGPEGEKGGGGGGRRRGEKDTVTDKNPLIMSHLVQQQQQLNGNVVLTDTTQHIIEGDSGPHLLSSSSSSLSPAPTAAGPRSAPPPPPPPPSSSSRQRQGITPDDSVRAHHPTSVEGKRNTTQSHAEDSKSSSKSISVEGDDHTTTVAVQDGTNP
ncbi:hypothetical protein RFI_19623 [Reticulomyxa filosa]|uniref:Uncharacterized protein n=1 Tax=Reticulomyxa filosa TaxID=46433 RepID=X6MUM9_RETFI|nr:hypothetical protein RFI_19623 [Reticulomyxa filosa]|eukprot:ETO17693.1 hypothetical protein RFI_19623 [Reticulomyxa filosa]